MSHLAEWLKEALSRRYELGRELGRGGMATIYAAEDRKHGRAVAIKVLRPELGETLAAERFLSEIEIAARLNHPHIVPLFDSGEANGLLYFVMPLVEGDSLRQMLGRRGRVPLDEALRVARHVAAALEYAHERGVVHRDIKPENVLLSGDQAVVTDFGIARAISAAGGGGVVTGEGQAVGTVGYMSPEQASGVSNVDARSDIYSLGCVLFEMLMGRPPSGWLSSRAVEASSFLDAAPEDRRRLDELPRYVERLLIRALAPDPEARLQSAHELRAGLEAGRVARGPGGKLAIAVLPFANLSGAAGDDYFGDGVAEEIINALSKVRTLRVAARTSSFAFKGRDQDIRAIGRLLNADAVLEGSVRRSGEAVRITAKLVSADDGCHLWSERYDRQLEDVFAIQDEIARSIARALELVLSEDEQRAMRRERTEHIEAYDYYLRGRQYVHQFSRKSLGFAVQMFDRAIALDPNYALAYTGVADCSSLLYMFWGSKAEDLKKAEDASARALALGPELAEAHGSRGLVLSLRNLHDEAAREFETALRLDPMLFEARYFYGRACFQQGEMERAVELFEEATRVREDYQCRFFAAQSHAARNKEGEAKAAYGRALQSIEEHLELNPHDSRAVTMGAVAHCRLGSPDEGLAWAARAAAIDPHDAGVAYNVACLYALEGETDEALSYLEASIQAGFGNREWLERDPDLETLRGDPRFEQLVRRVATPPSHG